MLWEQQDTGPTCFLVLRNVYFTQCLPWMFYHYKQKRRYILKFDLIFHAYYGVLSGINASSLGLKPSSEGKRWRLYILLQYHANLAQLRKWRNSKAIFFHFLIFPCANDIVNVKFEGFRTSLCIFRIVYFSVLSYKLNKIDTCSPSSIHHHVAFGMYESNVLSTVQRDHNFCLCAQLSLLFKHFVTNSFRYRLTVTNWFTFFIYNLHS